MINTIISSSKTSIFLLALFFFILYTTLSITRHYQFQSHALDLGLFTQTIYLYTQNFSLYNTLKHMPTLADHFDPILWIISPIYTIFKTPTFLLILQSGSISLSAIPIFFLIKDITKKHYLSIMLVISYLTSPAILSAISFDFHTGSISLLPFSLILYAWHFKKEKLYYLCLFISFLVKEDFIFFFIGLGIYQLLKKQLKLGISTILLSLTVFIYIKWSIMPFFWPAAEQGYIQTSTLPLTSPIDFLLLVITKPDLIVNVFFNSPLKMETIDHLLKPYGYLSLLSPFTWVTILPLLFFRFSSSLTYLWNSDFHNNAPIMPFMLLGAVYTIRKFNLESKFVYLLILYFLLSFNLAPQSKLYQIIPSIIHFKEITYLSRELKYLQQNPKLAVSAQTTIVPHVANREKVYLFPEISDAEIIILDTNLDSYPLDEKAYKKEIAKLNNSPCWILHTQNKSLLLFKKNSNCINFPK